MAQVGTAPQGCPGAIQAGRAERVAQAVWSITEQPREPGILRVEVEPPDILAVKFYQALTKHTENASFIIQLNLDDFYINGMMGNTKILC